MSDEYLEKLNKLRKSYPYDHFKKGYKSGMRFKKNHPFFWKAEGDEKAEMLPHDSKYIDPKKRYISIPSENIEAEKFLREYDVKDLNDEEEKGFAASMAYKLLGYRRSMESNLLGAQIYEKIGRGDSPAVKNRLLKKLAEVGDKEPKYFERAAKEVEEFLKRNPSKRKGLQDKVTAILGIFGIFFGVFFLANSITGNAIFNLSNSTTNNLAGGAIFIFGIACFLFYIKRNYIL